MFIILGSLLIAASVVFLTCGIVIVFLEDKESDKNILKKMKNKYKFHFKFIIEGCEKDVVRVKRFSDDAFSKSKYNLGDTRFFMYCVEDVFKTLEDAKYLEGWDKIICLVTDDTNGYDYQFFGYYVYVSFIDCFVLFGQDCRDYDSLMDIIYKFYD